MTVEILDFFGSLANIGVDIVYMDKKGIYRTIIHYQTRKCC